MSSFYSGADLKKLTLVKAGEITDGSSSYDALVMEYINNLYFSMLSGANEFDIDLGEPWTWAQAEAPVSLRLLPAYEQSTITISNGATSGSFGVAPTISLLDYYLKSPASPEYYLITAHTASQTAFTIQAVFNGVTQTAQPYKALKTRYELSSTIRILRLTEPFRADTNQETVLCEDDVGLIHGIDRSSFFRDYPLRNLLSRVPDRFCIVKDVDGIIKVEFNGYVSTETKVEAFYIPIPDEITDSDSSVPLVPRAFRPALSYGALYHILLDKNDSRAANYAALAGAKLKAMREHNRRQSLNVNSKSRAKIYPRQEEVTNVRRSPYLGSY